MPTDRQRVTVNLSPEAAEALRLAAEARNCSLSALVDACVRLALRVPAQAAAERDAAARPLPGICPDVHKMSTKGDVSI